MKKALTLFLTMMMLALLCASCTPGGGTSSEPDASQNPAEDGFSCTVDGENRVFARNTVGGQLFDRNYLEDGKISLTAPSPLDGFALTITASGTEKTAASAGTRYAIPSDGVLLFLAKDAAVQCDADSLPAGVGNLAHVSSGVYAFPLDARNVNTLDGLTGNVLFESSVTGAIPAADDLLVVIRRKGDGIFSVEEIGAAQISTRYLTLCLRDAYARSVAALWKKGDLIGMKNTALATPYGVKPTVVCGENILCGAVKNLAECGAGNIVLYDDAASYAASSCQENFTDYVVLRNRIAVCGKPGKTVVFPTYYGYVLRVCGDAVLPFGEEVTLSLLEASWSYPCCAVVNGIPVELNYFDGARLSYSEAVLYTNDFYAADTRTNEWGLEIAFADGEVTEVRPAAQGAASGSTPIPENGYVLSIAMNHAEYSALSRVKTGDTAELFVNEFSPYQNRKLKVDGEENAVLTGETVAIYDEACPGGVTPLQTATEYSVSSDGTVTLVVPSESVQTGGTPIPEGGFVIAATGAKANEIAGFFKEGMTVSRGNRGSELYFTASPDVLAAELGEEIEHYRDRAETLSDMSEAKSLLLTADELLQRLKSETVDAQTLTDLSLTTEKLHAAVTPPMQAPVRAAWVAFVPTNEADARQLCRYAASLGLNRLFLSPFEGTYAVYPSATQGVCTGEEYTDFDAVESMVRNAHENGLELHLMVCCFAAGTMLEGLPDNHYVNYFARRGKLLLSKKGNAEVRYYDAVSYTLDVCDPEVQAWELSLIRELLTVYQPDGLQLDYIRFPLPSYFGKQNYEDFGYNPATVAAFQAQYHTDWNPAEETVDIEAGFSERWEQWCAFRSAYIVNFVKDVRALQQELLPDGTLSVTCFADQTDRTYYVMQDTVAMAQYTDAVYDMIYADNYEDEYAYAIELRDVLPDKTALIAGIGTYVGATEDDLTRQCGLADTLGLGGISFFALEYTCSGHYTAAVRFALRATES